MTCRVMHKQASCSDENFFNSAANRNTESCYVIESFGRVTNYCCAAVSGLLPSVQYRSRYILNIFLRIRYAYHTRIWLLRVALLLHPTLSDIRMEKTL